MSINNLSFTLPPNPCINGHFQPPVYQFDNVKIIKNFFRDDEVLSPSFNGTVDFNIRDVANNYSLSCSWGYRSVQSADDWGVDDCIPVTGALPVESRIVTLLNLNRDHLMANQSLQDPIRIAQFWYCNILNGSYPEVYHARADVFLDVTCPYSGKRNSPVACNITTQLPVMVKARWQPRGKLPPGAPRLVPRPSRPVVSVGLDPPPTRDCTDVSFAYPDWILHDFIYKQPVTQNQPTTASLNFSISSRATGARVRCRWGADVGITGTDRFVGDYYMLPSCAAESVDTDPFQSQSVFQTGYNRDSRTLWIRQNWVCGDTAGQYSTEFAAEPAFQSEIGNFPTSTEARIPLYCTDIVCTAEPMAIEGSLTKPLSLFSSPLPGPEGASTPSCLFNSNREDSIWSITRFLWQTTTVKMDSHGGIGWFYPYPVNRTLQVQIRNTANGVTGSCNFNDVALDGETDRWWPCFRDREQDPHAPPLQRIVETYVQFSAKTGQLAINQTWYCNDTTPATPYEITAYGRTPSFRGLACGTSNSTWVGAPCPPVLAGPQGETCDFTYSARWCTLGDRDGGGAYPLAVSAEITSITRLPKGELTEPEPSPGIWSCTVSSLGRGPVIWRLQNNDWVDYIASTAWFGSLQSYHVDTMSTYFSFNLNSSVFIGRPVVAGSRDKDGVIRDVGISQEINGRTATPWLESFDPTRMYDDRTEYSDASNPGWRFYNALQWSVRFDLSTGYLELNHSWYCDDKDPLKPIVFNGTWNGYLPLNCSYDFPGPRIGDAIRPGIFCRFPRGEKEVVVTPEVRHSILDKVIPDRVPHW